MADLELIYRTTLERCRPHTLLRSAVRAAETLPRNVVAIGKAAGALLDGIPASQAINKALVIIPRYYPNPKTQRNVAVVQGGHPEIDASSFEAGEAVVRFVQRSRDVLFLISGGGSACVEKPLAPWFARDDLARVNRRLISSALPIGEINKVRKHLSAIKGGRLATHVKGRFVTLIYSDVSTGAIADVASGPTLPDPTTNKEAAAILDRIGGCDQIVTTLRDERLPETVKQLDRAEWRVIADNLTLTQAAAEVAESDGFRVIRVRDQVESDVATAAEDLALRAAQLQQGEILIAGGEPTVAVRGSGKGGRCMELAVRFAMKVAGRDDLSALFASSDGVDGNSGAAGVVFDRLPRAIDQSALAAALDRSDSFTAAGSMGRPIIIPPTGNNLRDLYLVARP